MNAPLPWPELIPRLEIDLRSRRLGTGETDDAAWYAAERLLREHARMLLRRDIMRRRQDIEEVVQNVLVKLQSPETLRRLSIAKSPTGYVAVMMRNALLDILRRNRRESERFVPADDVTLPDNRPAQPVLSKTGSLWRILDELNPDDRLILTMRFWQEMSLQKIADELHISYSAAAVRSFRALRRMRDLVDDRRNALPSK